MAKPRRAAQDHDLARDCARHARVFFDRPDCDLATAAPGSFALSPTPEMAADLARDYTAMSGMIFGEVPRFDDILAAITAFEATVNAPRR